MTCNIFHLKLQVQSHYAVTIPSSAVPLFSAGDYVSANVQVLASLGELHNAIDIAISLNEPKLEHPQDFCSEKSHEMTSLENELRQAPSAADLGFSRRSARRSAKLVIKETAS